MKRLGNNMDCMQLEGNPSAGQILGTNGISAVWLDKKQGTPDSAYAGAIRWTGSEPAIILCDGTNGRTVYLGPEILDIGGCCRNAGYYKFRTKALCIPPNGKDGQILVYVCGHYHWVDQPDCNGVIAVEVSFRHGTGEVPTEQLVDFSGQDPACNHIVSMTITTYTPQPPILG